MGLSQKRATPFPWHQQVEDLSMSPTTSNIDTSTIKIFRDAQNKSQTTHFSPSKTFQGYRGVVYSLYKNHASSLNVVHQSSGQRKTAIFIQNRGTCRDSLQWCRTSGLSSPHQNPLANKSAPIFILQFSEFSNCSYWSIPIFSCRR